MSPNSTLQSLVDEVCRAVARPDRFVEGVDAVLRAVDFLHKSAYYYKDRVEGVVQFQAPSNHLTLSVSTKFPEFRKLESMRHLDCVGAPLGRIICPVSGIASLGRETPEGWYVAGDQLNIRLTAPKPMVYASWFIIPELASSIENFDSWLARGHRGAVVDKALLQLAGDLGNNVVYAARQRSFVETFRVLQGEENEPYAN